MLNSIYEESRERMEKSIIALKNELKRVRTGRASLSLLDGIRVDYYGTQTPLNQMASLSVPESRLITIQPWDTSVINSIEKAILKSDLGLTPASDGKIIRISIPPLTEDRRKELVKLVNKTCEEYKVAVRNIRRDSNDMVVNKTCEEYKVAVRNIRRDSNDMVKELKKEGEVSEDEAFKAQDEIQKITDAHIEKIDAIYQEKEKEILEF